MNKTVVIFIASYFLLISLITAIITAADKSKAEKGSFRVPEKVLFILAVLGGSLAEYLTMKAVRHKTLHKRFMIGLPLIIIFQLLLVLILIFKFGQTAF